LADSHVVASGIRFDAIVESCYSDIMRWLNDDSSPADSRVARRHIAKHNHMDSAIVNDHDHSGGRGDCPVKGTGSAPRRSTDHCRPSASVHRALQAL